MRAKPAIVGAFILGALGLSVLAILFLGGTRLFARSSRAVVFFGESVAGLDVGAPVTFHGARIGSVQSIAIHFSPDTMTARIPVILRFDSDRVILRDARLGGQKIDFQQLIQAGLRAQLALQSLITGQLRVDLYFQPGTPAHLVGTVKGLPEIPAVPSDLDQLRNQLTGLPLRELAESGQRALAAVARLSDHLDAVLDPLAMTSHNSLDAATHALQTMDQAIHRVQTEASVTLQQLDVLLVDAHHQLDDRGGEVSRTLVTSDRVAQQAKLLLEKLNDFADPHSEFRKNLDEAVRDLPATTGALRGFAETIEHNPNALVWGRADR